MKKYYLVLSCFMALIMSFSTLNGQTESSLAPPPLKVSAPNGTERSISMLNPYLELGAKLGYVINSNADFSNNLLFSVRFRKNLYSSNKFVIPLVSNMSLGNWGDGTSDESVILTDNGLSLGMYPYFIINKGTLTVVPHFEVSAKIFPGESLDLSQKRYKVAGNIEVHMARDDGAKTTVSTGVFYSSNQNMDIRSTYGFDVTALIPLDAASAFLIDYKKPFNNPGLLSLGIVIK